MHLPTDWPLWGPAVRSSPYYLELFQKKVTETKLSTGLNGNKMECIVTCKILKSPNLELPSDMTESWAPNMPWISSFSFSLSYSTFLPASFISKWPLPIHRADIFFCFRIPQETLDWPPLQLPLFLPWCWSYNSSFTLLLIIVTQACADLTPQLLAPLYYARKTSLQDFPSWLSKDLPVDFPTAWVAIASSLCFWASTYPDMLIRNESLVIRWCYSSSQERLFNSSGIFCLSYKIIEDFSNVIQIGISHISLQNKHITVTMIITIVSFKLPHPH